VKRVVVATKATETEKVPESYFEREGHFYLVEFFPDPNARAPARGNDRDERGGRGNDRGRGGNDRGRGGNDRGGGGRPGGNDRGRDSFGGGERAPRADFQPTNVPRPAGAFAPRIEGAPAPVFPKKERAPRPLRSESRSEKTGERGPRPERADRGPRGPKGAGELRLVLKGQSQTTLQGSGTAEPAAVIPTVASENTTAQSLETPQA
jgi:hypothetical protein